MGNHHPRVLYLSHGGGPLPLLGDDGHTEMVENLTGLASKMDKPSAIVVISAHWEEEIPTITSAANPPLFYDYYGFPEESYRIEYPCPGEPALAKQIGEMFSQSGIQNRLDDQRGFDHGVFVPLKIMFPDADIPCIQISLLKSLNPSDHIQIGAALSGINDDGPLIIGSGFSFHNMRAFFEPGTIDGKAMNEAFEQWLIDTCSNPGIGESERAGRLENWENAPHARYCHPREEHFLPLHVCYGVRQTFCTESFELKILNKKSSMYLW
jgi:4,5-DOPA dioxygenase extradiol